MIARVLGSFVLVALGGCQLLFPLDAEDRPGDAAIDTPVPEDGLRVWLQMDQPPANGMVIESAEDRIATCLDCPTVTAGKIGGGYLFGNHLITIPTRDLAFTQFTVALWIQIKLTPGPLECMVSKPLGIAGANSFVVCINASHETEFSTHDPGEVADTLRGTQLELDSWNHLALTWDGGNKIIYIDGTPTLSTSIDVGFDTNDLFIGADINNGGSVDFSFNGVLDDVRLYDRALGEGEITILANPPMP
jgi:sialidase-1